MKQLKKKKKGTYTRNALYYVPSDPSWFFFWTYIDMPMQLCE